MFGTMKTLDVHMLRKLPAVIEAQRLAATERTVRRADLIRQIQKTREDFDRRDADLIANAAPIEKELATLRARVSRLEKELLPLADARLSAMFVCKNSVKGLESELRSDAANELHEFDLMIESTRQKIQSDPNAVLSRFKPDLTRHERVVEALRLTLDADREAHRLLVTEGDIVAALSRVCDELRAAGIDLRDSA